MALPSRIVVVGQSGSGKTTLGRWLARELDLPFTDLDDVFWRPGWGRAPAALFRADVDRLTTSASWVLAGNYSSARDLIWPRADTLVWLDLPLPLTLWRTILSVFRQSRAGEPICNGNRQTMSALVLGKEPLLWYAIRTVPQRRRTWPTLLAGVEHRHLTVFRFTSSTAVAQWQDKILASRRQNATQAGNTPVDR